MKSVFLVSTNRAWKKLFFIMNITVTHTRMILLWSNWKNASQHWINSALQSVYQLVSLMIKILNPWPSDGMVRPVSGSRPGANLLFTSLATPTYWEFSMNKLCTQTQCVGVAKEANNKIAPGLTTRVQILTSGNIWYFQQRLNILQTSVVIFTAGVNWLQMKLSLMSFFIWI